MTGAVSGKVPESRSILPAMTSTQYSLSEFSRISGVAAPDIRYCVRSGVIPRPAGRARAAKYSDEHLAALKAHVAARDATATHLADGPRYSLSEFSRVSGIPTQDIRYWVRTGIIPHPIGRARGAKYTEQHLEALRAHLADKATTAIRRSEPVVTAVDGEALPSAPAVWVELAPDVKMLLLPGVHGRTQEQLLNLMRLVTAVCGPMLRSGSEIGPAALLEPIQARQVRGEQLSVRRPRAVDSARDTSSDA